MTNAKTSFEYLLGILLKTIRKYSQLDKQLKLITIQIPILLSILHYTRARTETHSEHMQSIIWFLLKMPF